MRANTLITVGLAVAAAMVQAGCNRSSETSQDAAAPETTTGARSGGSVAAGKAKPRSNPVATVEPRSYPAATTAEPRSDPAAPAQPRSYSVTLPEGTPLTVRTSTALSTKTHQAGQSFSAHLEQPVVLNGRQIVPKGAEVEGTIVDSDPGGRVKDRATLAVQMTRLHTASGRAVEISTGAIAREANATKGKDAAKIGIGSGVGAAIGAIAGGGKGAAIGAAAGAGAGTGVVLATHGDPAIIPSETVLHFALTAPVTVTESR